MGPMLKKLNFYIEDDIRKDMEALVPAGQRTKVINEALRKELQRLMRERVHEKLMKIRAKTTPMSDEEILGALRKDRRRA